MFNRLFNFETRADRAKALIAWGFVVVPAVSFWLCVVLWAVFFSAGGWKEHRNIFFAGSFLGMLFAAGNSGWMVLNLYLWAKLKMIIKSHTPGQAPQPEAPATVTTPVYLPRPDGSGWSDIHHEEHTLESAKALTIKHPPGTKEARNDYLKRFGKLPGYADWMFRVYGNSIRKGERELSTLESPSPIVDFSD